MLRFMIVTKGYWHILWFMIVTKRYWHILWFVTCNKAQNSATVPSAACNSDGDCHC